MFFSEDAKNPTIDKKHFWRVHDRYSSVKFIIDGKDVTKANWMRHVQPAQGIHQNLVAYQDREEIYFLTVRQIDKDEELFVWYGYDFAKRLQERTSEDNWPVVPSTRIYQAGNYTQQPLSVEVSWNVNYVYLHTLLIYLLLFYKQFCILTLKYDMYIACRFSFSFLSLKS